MPLILFDNISGKTVNIELLKIGDVIGTYRDELVGNPSYLEISAQSFNLTKTDYPELHFHITNDSVDELFTVNQLILGGFKVYIKVL